MKTLTLLILLAAGSVLAQVESNLTITVHVPASVVEQARIYQWITGQTNVGVRLWMSSNVVVTLPPAVVETVEIRKSEMIQKIQQASLVLLRKVATEFGY